MSTFWMIEERVGRFYIVLDGIFTTKEAAWRYIARQRSNDHMRPVLYERGGWGTGPRRCI